MSTQPQKIISDIEMLPEENPCPVLRIDGGGILLFANHASRDLLTQWRCAVGEAVPGFVCNKLSLALASGLRQELEAVCGEQIISLAMVAVAERGYVNLYGSDITQRKRIEEQLAKSEERLKRAQEIASLGSWELNLADNSLSWSEEVYRLFGLQSNEFEASYDAFLAAVHPEDRDAVNVAYTNSLSEGRDYYEIEHRIIQQGSGKVLYVHEKCEHVRDETGKIVRSFGMVHDITIRKQKQMEVERLNSELEDRARELENINRELEAFNHMIAHDLRKPLTVIGGYSQILQDLLTDKLDPQAIDYLRRITNSTFNMSHLINALLDFSRLSHTEPKLEKVNITDLANLVITGLRLAEPSRNVTFRVEENLVASVDKVLIEAVLTNLFENAWKFTVNQHEAIIEFGMSKRDGKKVFFICDNGIGFSMEEAQRLYEPFQRLRGADDFTGFGVGLATVKRIIHRHRGEVWAEASPGNGATFYFSL